MKVFALLLALMGSNSAQDHKKPEKVETPHLAFVTEYIRELAAIEDIRVYSERQLAEGKKDEVFSTGIYISTRVQLELRSDVKMLNGMYLKDPFDSLIPGIAAFYEQKIELHQRLIDNESAFLAGPKPGIDYAKLAAEMPKIRATLDDIDHTLFQAAPTIFATLIDPKPDSKNHTSHLIVTKAERKKLIEDLDQRFGGKLDQKDQNYTVGAASVLKAYFLKDFKCSDEPWE